MLGQEILTKINNNTNSIDFALLHFKILTLYKSKILILYTKEKKQRLLQIKKIILGALKTQIVFRCKFPELLFKSDRRVFSVMYDCNNPYVVCLNVEQRATMYPEL